MDILTAYDLVLSKVDDLRDQGVKIEISKTFSSEEGDLPKDKWVEIHFLTVKEDIKEKLNDALKYFSTVGISFDVYGDNIKRTWQLDWSFTVDSELSSSWLLSIDFMEDALKEELELTYN